MIKNAVLFSCLKVFPVAIFQTWIKPNVSPLCELTIRPLSCQWQWCTFRVNNLTMNLCTWIKCTWSKTLNLHHPCVELELHLLLRMEKTGHSCRKKDYRFATLILILFSDFFFDDCDVTLIPILNYWTQLARLLTLGVSFSGKTCVFRSK